MVGCGEASSSVFLVKIIPIEKHAALRKVCPKLKKLHQTRRYPGSPHVVTEDCVARLFNRHSWNQNGTIMSVRRAFVWFVAATSYHMKIFEAKHLAWQANPFHTLGMSQFEKHSAMSHKCSTDLLIQHLILYPYALLWLLLLLLPIIPVLLIRGSPPEVCFCQFKSSISWRASLVVSRTIMTRMRTRRSNSNKSKINNPDLKPCLVAAMSSKGRCVYVVSQNQ